MEEKPSYLMDNISAINICEIVERNQIAAGGFFGSFDAVTSYRVTQKTLRIITALLFLNHVLLKMSETTEKVSNKTSVHCYLQA